MAGVEEKGDASYCWCYDNVWGFKKLAFCHYITRMDRDVVERGLHVCTLRHSLLLPMHLLFAKSRADVIPIHTNRVLYK